MSKKLVKTAKQQFEERLQELHVVKTFKVSDTEIYHHCIAADEEFILLREQDGEYKELLYDRSYEDVVLGERFLSMMTDSLAEASQPVKPLFDWYASADHDDEPFTLLDIYMADVEETVHYFEDLYEEVPDEPRVITAREQWEKDSAGAETVQTLANGSVYKVAVTDGSITFFVHQDGGEYFREIYPSFDELRKDVNFVMAYLSHVRSTHEKDVDAALAWLQGGKYTMSPVSLLDIYEVGKDIDHLCYHDKEEPAAEVTKQDFKEEIDALRKKMVEYIIELCEAGKTLNVETICLKRSITWTDSSYVDCEELSDFWLEKDKNGEWIAVRRDWGGENESSLRVFSINTLKDIIEAMQ